MKNIRNLDAYKKGYIDFCRQTHPPPRNGIFSRKWFFAFFSENAAFFQKTRFILKHPFTSFAIKKVILIFCLRDPLSRKNGRMRPQNSILQFPQKILLFLKKKKKNYITRKYLASNFSLKKRRIHF